jgi:hypothetical protein
LLSYSIPDLPKWILIEKSKLEFKRREALRQLETREVKNLKKFSKNFNSQSSDHFLNRSHDI